MSDQIKKRVVFTEQADSVISNIIKKYGLKESTEEFLKKMAKNEELNTVIIYRIVRNFAEGEISKNDLSNKLQKDLGLSPEMAKNLSEDITNNLVPLLENFSEKTFEEVQKLNVEKTIKPPIGLEKILEKETPPKILEKSTQIKKTLVSSEKIEKPKNIKQIKKSSDIYREPIE